MMSSSLAFQVLFHSLAHAVARGQSISAWAWSKDCSAKVALEWAQRPEFAELVEKFRLEAAKEPIGEIARSAAEANQIRGADSEQVEARKALNEGRIELSMLLELESKLDSLETRVKAFEEGRAVNLASILRNSRN